MRKTLYTLNIENYRPEITELTFPLIKQISMLDREMQGKVGCCYNAIRALATQYGDEAARIAVALRGAEMQAGL